MKKVLPIIILCALFAEFTFSQKDSLQQVKKDSTKKARKDSIRLTRNYYPFGSNLIYPFKGKNRKYEFPEDTIGIQTKFAPSLIVPGVFIGYGLTTIKNHGLISSYKADKFFDDKFAHDESPIDNYLIFSPYAEFAALLLLNIRNRDDFLNTTILILKAQIMMSAVVFPLKYLAHEERPYSYEKGLSGVPLNERKNDKQAFLSMPSGHTAEAFMAATIVYREYRYRSPWYGIGAYALATSVGIYRMINDQHWQSDVFVGAGIGMLSANMAYAFHEHRWGKHEVVVLPAINGSMKGFAIGYSF